ncbi:MAG: IclR family transcriptional regulator [Negativicutes bacterium]|nr:IclR family transcriptional regulator [Negativicutes bacterium]
MKDIKKPLVKSASRTLDIIEFIVKSPKPPSFTLIQQATDIPKSSLSYLLQELLQNDYLDYDQETRVYYPGIKLIQIGAVCINNTNMSREISLGVKRLSEELGETAHAGILDGRHIVYIAKCQGSKDLSIVTTIGHRLPAHATAIGKMLLSGLEQGEVQARLGQVKLERYTDKTITDHAALNAALAAIRRQGYAIDDQEIIPGGVCVAAPIVDKNNRTVAAMSATLAAVRVTEETLPEIINKVRQAAGYVSARLGNIQHV